MDEKLAEIISKAVKSGVKEALEESNNIFQNGKDPNELLTIEQVHKEYDIGLNMVRKIFQDKELPVQRYTSPFKVTRKAMNEYINTHHDYLSERR